MNAHSARGVTTRWRESDALVIEATVFEGRVDWRAIEHSVILATLAKARGNRAKAMKMLGMARSTFFKRLQEMDIHSRKRTVLE